jgi:uncharacterized protein YijF (DUF1287 family)
MTPAPPRGSHILSATAIALAAVISGGCETSTEANPISQPPHAPASPPQAAPAALPADPPASEACLGVADKGIFADLDERVQLKLPEDLAASRVSATVDTAHAVLVLSIDGHPRKSYPLGGSTRLVVGSLMLSLRPGDRAELAPLLTKDRIAEGKAAHDRDDDGIPDPLDILIGAKKTVINAAAYTNVGYVSLSYPGGDVPRHQGVCTDVIVRAVRNAGLDLQKALHEDILKRPKAFPMIKKRADANIDQRRVGTLLPYFKGHWESHAAALDDSLDPLRPGDIILMDTFPRRSGPDHIGIISDQIGPSGLPLVINNWTDGTVTSEMDLLSFVPVLYRFRLPA